MHNIVQPFSLAQPGSSSRSPSEVGDTEEGEVGDTEEGGRGIGGNAFVAFLTHALPFS